MRLIITGASGFLGQNLVPLLLARGVDLLLVGRDEAKLQNMFPDQKTTTYDGLVERGIGYDALLHLAVANNNSQHSLDYMRRVNVGLLSDVVSKCAIMGVDRLIYTGTTHQLADDDPYGVSKHEANEFLETVDGIKVDRLILPAVYVEGNYAGKLAMLNSFPKPLQRVVFKMLASLRPTLNVKRLADQIARENSGEAPWHELLTDQQEGNWFYHAAARAVDLTFAVFVLVFLGWLLILVWVAVKLSSKGPGIFAQERVGRFQEPFTLYKFRTMSVDTEQVGTHEVSQSAVTGVGRFLRASKIDELPQIFNIFKNEISLVGPRPCLASQTSLIEARDGLSVYDVKPGISGYAQVLGVDMSEPNRLASLDAHYIKQRTLILDLKIILKTALGRRIKIN